MEPGSVFLLLYAVYASLASAATGHVAGNVAGEDRIALAVKTLAEILDDLEYLDEEEEKNDIDTGRFLHNGNIRNNRSQAQVSLCIRSWNYFHLPPGETGPLTSFSRTFNLNPGPSSKTGYTG